MAKQQGHPSDSPMHSASEPAADLILNALPHPILVLGAENKISYANFPAEVLFGVSAPMLCRRTLDNLVAFSCPLLALVRQVRESGAGINEYGVELTLGDGHSHNMVDVFATVAGDEAEHIILMLQHRNMAQMIERQLSHRGAARSVSGLAAVLAHEIKNPLSGIRGAAQLLETGAGTEDKPLAQLICDEADRICHLVDRMEVFGDERPLKSEPVNIHSVLDHVKSIAERGFAQGLTITQTYDPSLPPLPGNREKLIQAFLNLVKNAAEAINSDGDGKILLTTAFRPGIRFTLPNSRTRVSLPLEICVIDNGEGISEELRPYLFEPFVTSKPTGTGLGLALVAKIIGDHGGVIECESKPRQTIFRVLMPMMSDPAALSIAARQDRNRKKADHGTRKRSYSRR